MGRFHKPIDSGPRITDGDFTYNFKDADGNLYLTTSSTVENEAGLYWWNPDLSTPAYELLKAPTARNQVHVLLTSSYTTDNRRIQANLATGETEVDGDMFTFLAPSAIGGEVSGTGVSLYLGGSNAAHTIVNPAGDDVHPGDLVAGTRYWVQAVATSYVLIEEPGAAGTLFGRGEPPEATAARVGLQYLDLISKVLYGCFDDPHRTSQSTGDFDDITQTDITINLVDRLEDITVVEDEWLYRVGANRFYSGTDVGASQLAWVDDIADNALAESLTTATNTVVWLGRHIDNEEALRGLTAIVSGEEYFFYREQDGDIVHLDNSTFSAAGSTVAHPFWFPVKADDREEHIFNARNGLPTLANDGSDDNRIGITNDGVFIVDVDPINATDPSADSWADYTATDYEGAFAADPTIDTGEWYANYVRRTFREFESSNFGLGWIPHEAPTGFIGWYTSRQDALNHAAERGVADDGDFVAFTGTSGTPKVETATGFTAATSKRIQRNWEFIPVGGGKADTDLQNIDDDLTVAEKGNVQERLDLPRLVQRDSDGDWPDVTEDDIGKVIGIDGDRVYVVHPIDHITISDDTLFEDVEIDGTDPEFSNIYGAYNQGDSTGSVIPEGGLIYAIDTDRWLAKGSEDNQFVVADAPDGWLRAFSAHGSAISSGLFDSITEGDTPTQFFYTSYYNKLEKVTAYGTHTIHSTTYSMALAEAHSANSTAILPVTGEYEIAEDGSRSAASHRWLGNFYEVKQSGRLKSMAFDVKPTGASRYDIWYWKLTRNGAADYERDSDDDGTRVALDEVSAADHTLEHTLSTAWKVEEGEYIWVGLRSNQSSGHASVVHDASESETVDLLDFVGWTQADDTGGSTDALTGNLWHSNSQDSAFHAKFEIEYDVTAHFFIEKDGHVVNTHSQPVLDFRGDNIVIGKADDGAKTTIAVEEPEAATVEFDAGGLEQMHSSGNLTVVRHDQWASSSDTPDFTWPTIDNDEEWVVYVEHIEHSAHAQLPLVAFRGSAINGVSSGTHGGTRTHAQSVRVHLADDIDLFLGRTSDRDLLVSASADGTPNNGAYDFRRLVLYRNNPPTLTVDGDVATPSQAELDDKADIDLGNISLDTTEQSSARTGLGLGTAAIRNTGESENNVPILDADGKLASGVIPDDVGGAFDLHEDVTSQISSLDANDRFVVSDENLSGDPNRYVPLEDVATKLAGTNIAASSGVLSVESEHEVQDATSTTYSASLTRLTVVVDQHPADGDILSFVVPSNIDDSALDLNLQTNDGSNLSVVDTVHGQDRENLTPADLTAGWIVFVQLTADNWYVISPTREYGVQGPESSDSTLTFGLANILDETTVDVPTGTWAWINPGVVVRVDDDIRVGAWERFLVADLTGLDDTADGDESTYLNTISFGIPNTMHAYRIGKTSGDKITVAVSSPDFLPSEIRIRG